MTLTVCLPHRVEQELAEYCVKRRVTKSEAVKLAMEGLLRASVEPETVARHPFIGGDTGDGSDVSGNIKAALRARWLIPAFWWHSVLHATSGTTPLVIFLKTIPASCWYLRLWLSKPVIFYRPQAKCACSIG